MARKYFPKVPTKKKALPRGATPPSSSPPLLAHPRLIHGFLVRRTAETTVPSESGRAVVAAVANIKTRAQASSEAKHEGPTDDATFH